MNLLVDGSGANYVFEDLVQNYVLASYVSADYVYYVAEDVVNYVYYVLGNSVNHVLVVRGRSSGTTLFTLLTSSRTTSCGRPYAVVLKRRTCRI